MFLVDMSFNNVNEITPELTELHRKYLADEYRSGKLMFGGRKEPRTGGIILSKHESKSELENVIKADPFIQSGAVKYSITEFIPVMASEGFESLLVI